MSLLPHKIDWPPPPTLSEIKWQPYRRWHKIDKICQLFFRKSAKMVPWRLTNFIATCIYFWQNLSFSKIILDHKMKNFASFCNSILLTNFVKEMQLCFSFLTKFVTLSMEMKTYIKFKWIIHVTSVAVLSVV